MFFRTDKVNGHDHVGYKPGESGTTSEDKGHNHTFSPRPAVSPNDPRAGELVCSPGSDGHVHVIDSPLFIESDELGKPKRSDKATAVAEVRRLFKESLKYEESSRKSAEESERFYEGDQWTDEDRQELKNQKRACLTLNEIESKMDLLSGYQRQNRSDIKFLPVESGDARVADVLNILVKNICDQNDFEFEETQVFEDGLIAGRGFFHTFVDNDKNIEGDIVIERWPWRDGYCGPHVRPDLKDCEYLFKSKWFSEAKIEQMFPDHFKSIRSEYAPYLNLNDEGADEVRSDGQPEDSSKDYPDVNKQLPDPDFVNIGKKEVRMLECWRRQYDRVSVAVAPHDGFYQNLTGVKKADIAAIKTIPGMRVVDRRVDKVRKTVVVSSTLISDEYTDLYDSFPLIPFYAKKRKAKFWGKVESVKDPQREINKRHSQLTDILNKVAAYGWFYDQNTFETKTDELNFKATSAKPGFTQKVKNAKTPPVKVEGVKFPNEVVALMEIDSGKLREILNINPELLGMNSKSESGVAQIEKKRQGLIGNEFLFDNLDRAKKSLGRVLIRMIQRVYSPERVLRVVESTANRAQVSVGKAPYDPSRAEEIKALFDNPDLAKYDVAVTESAFSPTQRRANFVAWGDLARNGFPVPPDLLIDLSDLPEKEKVKESMAAQSKAAEERENRKYDAEIQKAQIAAQSKASGGASSG